MQEFSLNTARYQITGLQQLSPIAATKQNIPIIALHGWLDNAASFIPISQYLIGHGLYAIDMVGHGKSDHRSADANYHLVDWVQDLYQILDTLGFEKVILMGHSLGGIIASMFASCFPERVERLILVESFGPLTEVPEKSVSQLRSSIESRYHMYGKTIRQPQNFEHVVKARKQAGDLTEQDARILMQRNISIAGDRLNWRSDPRLRTISSLRLTEKQAVSFISEIQCPTLTILGDKGFQKMKDMVSRREKHINNMVLYNVSGGHHCHMESPEETAQRVNEFLK